jgi:hypothetical protein
MRPVDLMAQCLLPIPGWDSRKRVPLGDMWAVTFYGAPEGHPSADALCRLFEGDPGGHWAL